MRKGINLGFGLSSSEEGNFAQQILGVSDEINGQRPLTSRKNTKDASKSPDYEEVKPKTQVIRVSFYVILVIGILAFSGHWLYNCKLNGSIDVIAQTGPIYCALSTHCLAELLGLCADKKVAFSSFDMEKAYKNLEKMHIMQYIRLKKIKPNTLYIEYSLKEPVALLQNYTNTAIDIEGHIFAFAPFYSPRRLPSLCLSTMPSSSPWGRCLDAFSVALINNLFNFFGSEIERIDLSHINASSLGEREVVLGLQGAVLLRLPVQDYMQYVKKYLMLKKTMGDKFKEVQIVDMRLPDMAFLQCAACIHNPSQKLILAQPNCQFLR